MISDVNYRHTNQSQIHQKQEIRIFFYYILR